MSFECKYKNNDYCELRKLECVPGAKGCVLTGKVRFITPESPQEKREQD